MIEYQKVIIKNEGQETIFMSVDFFNIQGLDIKVNATDNKGVPVPPGCTLVIGGLGDNQDPVPPLTEEELRNINQFLQGRDPGKKDE